MLTVKVWVLVYYMGVSSYRYQSEGGGPLVIDNIASEQDCKDAADRIKRIRNDYEHRWECLPVNKVKIK